MGFLPLSGVFLSRQFKGVSPRKLKPHILKNIGLTVSACKQRVLLFFLPMFAGMWLSTPEANAALVMSPESFRLDSIAQWGKFPRFCVDVYRWGDKFFNSYDSVYVQGSGKRWNVKFRTDSWLDIYNFRLVDGYRMDMVSQPSTTFGLYLTYMAVSVGYDLNVNKILGKAERTRKRFNLQFNCSLFAMEFQTISNDVGTTVRRIGFPDEMKGTNIDFRGINTSQWQLDMYYFFNHRRYSQGAAYYYSKIQTRSAGSFYAGLSFWSQRYEFDFRSLENELFEQLPDTWNYNYSVNNKNYAIRVGYAYNWVFRKGWCLGTSLAPTAGLRWGSVNRPGERHTSFAVSVQARLSLIYNLKKRWFFGLVGRMDGGLIYDKEHSLLSSSVTCEVSAGFRFDLWK